MKQSATMKFVMTTILCILIFASGKLMYKLDPLNELEFNLKLLLKIPLIVFDTSAAVLLFWVMTRPTTNSSSNSTTDTTLAE